MKQQFQPPCNQQIFNPVMYVTGPPQTTYPGHDDLKQSYPGHDDMKHCYPGHDEMKHPKSNGDVYMNGKVPHHNHSTQRKTSHHSKSERGGPPPVQRGGPPPVQSKWVDLNDPNQKVRKGRSHRHNPAVVRSTSAGSVKSQGSVGSNYSTKSEQFKNSVRIPDSKFSGSWTSNESVGRTSSRTSTSSKQGKRVREWDVDVGRKPDIMMAKPPPSLKSSCGNVSTGSSGKRPPYLTGHLSSSTPPPSYHSDPLSLQSPVNNNGSVGIHYPLNIKYYLNITDTI